MEIQAQTQLHSIQVERDRTQLSNTRIFKLARAE
jgi:hypothetical protein